VTVIWFARLLFQLALAVWLGETIFLSLVAAPVLFTSMPAAEAGQVMSLLFPYYYGVGAGCGALLVIAAVVLWRRLRGGALWWASGGAFAAVMVAITIYAAVVMQPRLHALRAARDAGDATAQAEFDRLHHLSVQLNGAVLLGNLLILGLVAQSRAWRASGRPGHEDDAAAA
jgi:hypothetical protein